MATITKLKAGQTLYELRSVKMGNTRTRRTACFDVRVMEIAPDGMSIKASWNGNLPPREYSALQVSRLKVNRPEPKRVVMGLPSYR